MFSLNDTSEYRWWFISQNDPHAGIITGDMCSPWIIPHDRFINHTHPVAPFTNMD